MLITLQQLKTSLQAIKKYIDSKLPRKISDLPNDTGYITSMEAPRVSITDNGQGEVTMSIDSGLLVNGDEVNY